MIYFSYFHYSFLISCRIEDGRTDSQPQKRNEPKAPTTHAGQLKYNETRQARRQLDLLEVDRNYVPNLAYIHCLTSKTVDDRYEFSLILDSEVM